MPRIIRQGDNSLGHCWPPTAPIPSLGLQRKVFSEGLPIIVVGDSYLPHPGPCGNQPPHPVATFTGSENVFIGGLPIVRDGDPLDCGDVANTLGGSVFCNGGGRGPENRPDLNQTYGFTVSRPTIAYQPLDFTYRIVRPIGSEEGTFAGCQIVPIRPIIYTGLAEEGGGSGYRNYPGEPFSLISGGLGLPEYASNFIKNPIPILGINFSVATDNSFFFDVVGDSLGNGIKINKLNGTIFGAPNSFFESKILKVKIRNFVGESEFNFNISLNEVSNCP